MSRGGKIALGVLAVLAVVLGLNTLAVDSETKGATVTIEGGRILDLPGGDIQVVEQGPTTDRKRLRERGQENLPPIALIHCYACSLHWWDRMAAILDNRQRVIRLDLLGHGGSEKPSSGYGIEQQASLVAGALNELGAEGAVVVGHSMGATVATALAEQSSELVDRVVVINEAPDDSYGGLGLLARAQYVPVLGQGVWRIGRSGPWSEATIERGYEQAFAPGYAIADGFPNPDQVVDDYEAMTYTAFEEAHDANSDYRRERPLTERLSAAVVPVLVIFGLQDQLYDSPQAAASAYESIQGAVIAELENAGHSPNVERPGQTAALIREFGAELSDAQIPPPPGDAARGAEPRERD